MSQSAVQKNQLFAVFKVKVTERAHVIKNSPDVILCGWLGLKHQLTN